MNARSVSQGLRLVLKEERAEAVEWQRHEENPGAETRSRLFERYKDFALGLSYSEWKRLGDLGLERADTNQLAFEALLSSIDRFDPRRGVPFTAFSAKRIKGAIRNALPKTTEANAYYNASKRAERERLKSLKDSAPVEATDPLEFLREIALGLATGLLIEGKIDPQNDDLPGSDPSAYDAVAWRQLVVELKARLDHLPEREAAILKYHYDLDIQFSEIAQLFGISKGRVSQLHAQALKRLRSALIKFR